MDPDAAAYITAVETADGQALEEKTKIAIDNFVLGCKADGIWTAIKASCILAGARTLAGALVPLVGTAPTNYNFVAGDYNRKTGLVGDASTKYLDSNRAENSDPQNSQHMSAYATVNQGAQSATCLGVNGTTDLLEGGGRSRNGAFVGTPVLTGTGFKGVNRSNSTSFNVRMNGSAVDSPIPSVSPSSGNVFVFARNNPIGGPSSFSRHRLAFYSIGESLDLARLDARVTDLINAFGAAIP
jgi:hypothetical protein